MSKTIKYSFCTIKIYDDYVVATMNKGIHLTPDKNKILDDIANEYFYDRLFVYITYRKNSYSVDPSIYLQTSKIENLLGFAVVAKVPLAKGNAEIEKLFLNKPFEIFTSLKEAKSWVKTILNNE